MTLAPDAPGPHFLCIGALKTGTTWLAHNLRHHPDVWMPPVKELNYFRYDTSLPLITQVWESSPQGARVRRYARILLRPGDGATRRWYARYLLHRRSDRWYRLLFAPANGRLTGDVSPGYGRMDPARIAHVHALLPEAKIIFLLRNPMQKVWSQTAMKLSKRGRTGLAHCADDVIAKMLNEKTIVNDTRYLHNLGNWENIPIRPTRSLSVSLINCRSIQKSFIGRSWNFWGWTPLLRLSLQPCEANETRDPTLPYRTALRASSPAGTTRKS